MTTAIIHGQILNADVHSANIWLTGYALIINQGRIQALVPENQIPDSVDSIINAEGHRIIPGFFDTQVNGGGGVLFNELPSVEGIATLAKAHRAFGTTALLPTLISDDLDVMQTAINAVDAAIEQGVPGVEGIHLEGPFLNPARKGVHDAAKFKILDDAALEVICSLKHGKTLVTLAPEMMDTAIIKTLIQRGIVVAAGHTAATYEQTVTALAAGITSFTHLFNAMTPMASREPGVTGAALEDENSWCGIIVDGHHVHRATLNIAIKAKPRGKIVLVTDAMPTVGSTANSFVLNGEPIFVDNGRCTTASGTLAGSALDMLSAVKNCAEWLNVGIEEAVLMASLYPAQMLKLDSDIGNIAVGKKASFLMVDENFNIQQLWINGVQETLV